MRILGAIGRLLAIAAIALALLVFIFKTEPGRALELLIPTGLWDRFHELFGFTGVEERTNAEVVVLFGVCLVLASLAVLAASGLFRRAGR